MTTPKTPHDQNADTATPPENNGSKTDTGKKPEIGGRGGLDPARYGDWEIGGRCVDF